MLLALHGQRMVMTNDEGIVLESAQRMAAGGRIYVDFFGYMSPGSYWLQALVFKLLGVALWTGRLIVILDFALQCALVYWLAAQTCVVASRHRGDDHVRGISGSRPVVPHLDAPLGQRDVRAGGIVSGGERAIEDHARGGGRWIASGAALAAAAWCTPSVAIVAVVVALWLAASRERRESISSPCWEAPRRSDWPASPH